MSRVSMKKLAFQVLEIVEDIRKMKNSLFP